MEREDGELAALRAEVEQLRKRKHELCTRIEDAKRPSLRARIEHSLQSSSSSTAGSSSSSTRESSAGQQVAQQSLSRVLDRHIQEVCCSVLQRCVC